MTELFDRTGLILYTLKYDECVEFYQNIIELEIMFKATNLTCFAFGESYLMVEFDDEHTGEDVASPRQKTCLRMNVSDVKQCAQMLIERGVDVNYQEHSWGTVAKFYDPDGNLCAFKDSGSFEKQLNAHRRF
jgi:lactoylglutathione lyase